MSETLQSQAEEPIHPVTRAVREIRAAQGLSQEAFAGRWGVRVSVVRSIEQGRRVNPTWRTLARLVHRVGCDPRRLFEKEGASDGDERANPAA